MNQQYQHIEYEGGVSILKMTPRMRELWNAHERAMDRLVIPDEVLERLRAERPAKHPLLMPPFVKEKR